MILVIGGAGYIGSHMCKLLRQAGEEHLVLDNLGQGHRAALEGSSLLVGDLRNSEDLRRIFEENEIDLVMHFAAFISVGESVREPAKYWENNTLGVFGLLQSMRAHGVSNFVFSSTAAVFGEPAYLPIDETHPKNPTSPYGDSKLAVERMLSNFDRAYNLRSICLRYFNAAGADPEGKIGEDHEPEEHLVPLAIGAALGRGPLLKVFGNDYDTADGTCVRDYVHVLDLAEAHLLAIRHLRQGGDSRQYNLGNGRGFSVKEVLDSVGKVTGQAVPYDLAARRPGDPAKLIAASEKIKSDWGWNPAYPKLETIVETAWNWHRSHPDGFGDPH